MYKRGRIEIGGGLLAAVLGLGLCCSPGARASGQVYATFPQGFRWCVATSGHQIEGWDTNSDWWDFEQVPGNIANGDKSGAACDGWNRVEQDVELLKQLNVGEYRFSVEWARIEPEQGVWDYEAARHYRDEVLALRKNGIEPMITLQHFTMPRWLRAKGGWNYSGVAAEFGAYARFVYQEVGPEVTDWITVNEPMVNLVEGYMSTFAPPALNGAMSTLVGPVEGLLRSHAAAYHAIHAEAALRRLPVRVGIAHHLRVFDPGSASPLDSMLADDMDQVFNWSIGDAIEAGEYKASIPFEVSVDDKMPEIKGTQDFIGVNYYTRDMVSFNLSQPGGIERDVNPESPLNDVGWEIYPEGFYRVLTAAAKHFPGKPIFVTENGIADANDAHRAGFIEDHLVAMRRAMDAGVPVIGYCHWSLMDNFEWALGFAPKFGLYRTDFATQERIARPSAGLYGEIAAQNRLTSDSEKAMYGVDVSPLRSLMRLITW